MTESVEFALSGPSEACRRRADWQHRLAEYLCRAGQEPFAWGTHDCCCFAAGAVEAMTGRDAMKGFRGYRTRRGAARVLRTRGAGTLDATLEMLFGPPVPPAQGRRGDLAYAHSCVGVIHGRVAFFLDEGGYRMVPLRGIEKVFRVG